jgi:hypothetical protein
MYIFAGPFAFAKSSANDFYVVVPVKGRVLGAKATGDVASIAAASTVSLKASSHAINVMAFGASYSAGDVIAGTQNASYGDFMISAGGALNVHLAAAGVSGATAMLTIDFDEFARTD